MNNWEISSRNKLLLWLFQFFIVIAILIYQLTNQPLKLNADLLSLFEASDVSRLDEVVKKVDEQNINRQIILVGDSTLNAAIESAQTLTNKLSNLSLIQEAILEFPSTPELENIVGDYLPYRHNFLSDEFKSVLSTNNTSEIFSYQFTLLNQIANPAVSLTFEKDPTLSLADFFSNTPISNKGLSKYENYLVAQFADKHYVLIAFTPKTGELNINSSQLLSSSILNLIEASSSEILYTGSIFYTSEASKSGQQEMMLYGGFSVLATLSLILFAYRSLTALIATTALIAVSFLYGYLALSSIYNQINIIVLVFSVTLIGIAADYSFHALTQLKYSLNNNKKSPLSSIYSSLIMSYITTGAGYSLLLLSPFTLFQQIALFTLFGLFGALITVLLCYPILQNLIGSKSKISSIVIIEKIHNFQKRLTTLASKNWYGVFILFLLSLVVIINNHKSDDVRDYYQPNINLKQMENKIKQILKTSWENQYFIVEGESSEEVLQNEELLIQHLAQLVSSSGLDDYSAISQMLPSGKTQKENFKLVKNSFESGHFSTLQKSLPSAEWDFKNEYNVLDTKTWFSTSVGKLFSPQWIQHNNQYYSLVRLSGIKDLNSLNLISDSIDKSNLIDKANRVSVQMSQFKLNLVYILLAAFTAALVLFSWRYGIRTASLGLLTPFVSLIFALLLSYIFQQQLNIFNFIAGILILALGLDYSVFYAEHGMNKKITLTTLMSALSSTFVFAILMLSSMPAIKSFGITVFIGISLVFLFSPIVTNVKENNL